MYASPPHDAHMHTYPPRFDVICRLSFNAACGSILNEDAGTDPTIYPAFVAFESYTAVALAGFPMKFFRKFTEAQAQLIMAVNKVPKK